MNNFYYGLVQAAQFEPNDFEINSAWLGHLRFTDFLIREAQPKILVELGAHWGHSYFAFCESIVRNGVECKAFAIDCWDGDEQAGLYGEDVFSKVTRYNESNYYSFSSLVRKRFEDAVADFDDRSIDILHIDGLHTYEAVKNDYETWLPKLSPGAIILFHDICVHKEGFGVSQFWDEVKEKYDDWLEFDHSYGLGVVRIPGAGRSLKWLESNDHNAKSTVSNYFKTVGQIDEFKYQIRAISEISEIRKGEIEELHRQLGELSSQLYQSTTEKQVIYNSLSWRITKPLRFANRKLKSAVTFPYQLITVVRATGGAKGLARKILQTYRERGWRGFIDAYRHVSARIGGYDQFIRNDYSKWVERYEPSLDLIRSKFLDLERRHGELPLISIVMPVYNPNLEWLASAISSVTSQIYQNWQLCIADDCSTDPAIRPYLEGLSSSDSRIKVIFREENGHISAASNSALSVADGAWVALLDQDDLLSVGALVEVAKAIENNPEASLIYSDEDKIDEKGNRFSPYFKTDFNRHLFYAQNMISHLGVYRKTLLEDIGGFRLGLEGAQDYDLALRCIERILPQEIVHIPKVLYHWRVHTGSTSGGADAKPYAMIAGERALNDHFRRIGKPASAELIGFGYRLRYELPEPKPSVSIVIPTRDNFEILKCCIDSIIEKTNYDNFEVLIVDNGSVDPDSVDYINSVVDTEQCVHVLRIDLPFNYSLLNNQAVKSVSSDVVVLVNDDIEVVDQNWLSELVSFAVQPEIGAVGCKLTYPNGTIQHAGLLLGVAQAAGHAHKHFPSSDKGYFGRAGLVSEFSAVTGACLAVERRKYIEVGGLDEELFPVAYNDVDFCIKIKERGYLNILTPFCSLIHHESITRGDDRSEVNKERLRKERKRLIEKWGDKVEIDPYYSPNLSAFHEDFSLAWPPRSSS